MNIVQNARLLKVCGSASNAFMNLADAAGLKVRRLLLLDPSGDTMHVVAEVQWGDRWVVVNPQQGLVFKDQLGRALNQGGTARSRSVPGCHQQDARLQSLLHFRAHHSHSLKTDSHTG